jgi:hypothetical protein
MIILSLAFCGFLLEVLVATRVLRATLTHAAIFRLAETPRGETDDPN